MSSLWFAHRNNKKQTVRSEQLGKEHSEDEGVHVWCMVRLVCWEYAWCWLLGDEEE